MAHDWSGERILTYRGKALPRDSTTTLEAREIYHDADLYLLRVMTIFIKTLSGKIRSWF